MTRENGYLYIISNPAWQNWIKIGTTDNIEKRLFTYQTGDPFRAYKLEYLLFHPQFREAEKQIKETIKSFALEIKGEWYKISTEMAKSRLDEVLESYQNGEWKV